MIDCTAGLYLLVLVNGLPYGEICTAGEDDLPVASLARHITGDDATCPYTGTVAELVACARVEVRIGGQVLRVSYGRG